jgi:triosephosphate isomerase
MYLGTPQEASAWAQAFGAQWLSDLDAWVNCVIFPPFTALPAAYSHFKTTPAALGGQNFHLGQNGAFTGEIALPMLKSLGASWVLVGHSERRQHFNESDAQVSAKVRHALEAGFRVMLCLGEPLAIRQANKEAEFVVAQLHSAISGLAPLLCQQLAVAYEPIWAIGTGVAATPEAITPIHAALRHSLVAKLGDLGQRVPLLYGGSVNPANARQLAQIRPLDGFLVGSASLEPSSFIALAKAWKAALAK